MVIWAVAAACDQAETWQDTIVTVASIAAVVFVIWLFLRD